MPGVSVTVTNVVLGTMTSTVTDGQGLYSFPKLPVGRYDLALQVDGFKPQKRTGVAVDADSAVQINVTLELGEQSETVTVSVNAVRVDTVSTQLGEVVASTTMTTLSLNGRSYTDLLAIQPGVIPTTTIQSNSVIMAGVTGPVNPSGGLNPGIVSVSGQRETANGFYVNGGDVQERMNGGTGVVPNLDSIEEFRLLTNNFDPEYGNYNGGIVNVVTKSGSDTLHGNLFEFFRNTNLDARNYFSPERAAFEQHQPGGTIGGALKKGKIFFFGDYQATRTTQGIETGNISVPSMAQRSGNMSDIADQLSGSVNGSVLGLPAGAETRLPGGGWRAVLHAGLHERRAVRVSERVHSEPGLVESGTAAAAVHAGAERGAEHAVYRRLCADGPGRQGLVPRGRQHEIRADDGVLLHRRLPPLEPVSRPAGRRERAGIRRADARPRADVVV